MAYFLFVFVFMLLLRLTPPFLQQFQVKRPRAIIILTFFCSKEIAGFVLQIGNQQKKIEKLNFEII